MYKGQTLGGPIDGINVKAACKRLISKTVTEIEIDDGVFVEFKLNGQYVWQSKGEYFLWQETSNMHYLKTGK